MPASSGRGFSISSVAVLPVFVTLLSRDGGLLSCVHMTVKMDGMVTSSEHISWTELDDSSKVILL